ncbi:MULTISPECIES: hypothetical protein [Aequorivita]|uniref:Uncharacterized protein n=2 Tax=Aequorivita TaxID=153265 RepID=A0AB35YNP3_9FLAO|nr:hypothetical protein [Aequorivita sp. Ant34-E75]WGF92063.1 hypothetical protein QCQ61_12710 [Aequorivita sp. Ant34-E75]
MTRERLRFRQPDKKSLIQGGIIVFIIGCTPLLYYAYESFPSDTQVWKTFLFTFTTEFPSIYQYAWFLTGKIIPVILLLIWFFTCKHWWHWIILVPLSMYVFQLFNLIKQNFGVDEVEIIYVIPIMMVVIPFVYLIRAKLFSQMRQDDLKSFEKELLEKQSIWQQIKELFR